jgi:hypothetical protein
MPITVLPPGGTKDEANWWPKDFGANISVVVLGPTGSRVGCLTTRYGSGQPKGIVRISQQRPKCPRYRGAGPGG